MVNPVSENLAQAGRGEWGGVGNGLGVRAVGGEEDFRVGDVLEVEREVSMPRIGFIGEDDG